MSKGRVLSAILASLGILSTAYGQNDGNVKSNIRGSNSYISSTSKKRSKSHGVRKPIIKSVNKISQIAANFNQDVKGVNKARPRSKSVDISTEAKVGLGVGVPLGSVGVATGLGLGIRHSIRKYGKCDLIKNVYVCHADESGGYSSVGFTYDNKSNKTFKLFEYQFFLVSTGNLKGTNKKIYLLYKGRSLEVENNKPKSKFINLPNWGDLVHEEYYEEEHRKYTLKKLPGGKGEGKWLYKDNDSADRESYALINAAKFLAEKVVENAKQKMDDRGVNKAYSEKVKDLELFVENKIIDKVGLHYKDSDDDLIEFGVCSEKRIGEIEKNNGFKVHCILS